jgi:hypothetical protein
MPSDQTETEWLSVIAKALAYYCLQDAAVKDANRVSTLLGKINFLEGLASPKTMPLPCWEQPLTLLAY